MTAAPKPLLIFNPKFRHWVRHHVCCVCEQLQVKQWTLTQVAHLRNRKDNGDANNCLPICAHHHLIIQHNEGIETFKLQAGLDLAERARHLWEEYCEMVHVNPETGGPYDVPAGQ